MLRGVLSQLIRGDAERRSAARTGPGRSARPLLNPDVPVNDRFGTADPKPYEFIGFGDIHGPNKAW